MFNYLTLNIYLFIFNLFDFRLWFSKNHIFSKQERQAVYRHASLVSYFKLVRYLRDINEFLRYRSLCKSILKCGLQLKQPLWRFEIIELEQVIVVFFFVLKSKLDSRLVLTSLFCFFHDFGEVEYLIVVLLSIFQLPQV